ncbi:ABC-type nitrate/sulfonate/bicarbonate transportsystem, ATPase component [Halapricum desulfuricans]|uniref:Molybdate/tungstate import ATP-binding protein WtpC n=1 Tax=Halapricum desulfuricans TaxID=2841257 RepID=A0A897NIK6_9EURY|nr:ABC transporter ATP-binding protein [Halapricum desulfuricans]QSG12582.1 ABC-type nitrate/sulfonate/bicarbonate transportsystem, ATPase component [Halapricum desulfuricans]
MAIETTADRVAIDDVSMVYDGSNGPVEALREVSFAVDPGEFVTIVGPSGCGKTTLFRIIAGLQTPTEGEVRLDGDVIDGPGPELGIVFQEYHLFPWRTVSGNVGFGLEQDGTPAPERRERVEQLLETVGLDGFGDTHPKDLSGGMKQRVALARALAPDPDLLLMDEPFGAVDAQTKAKLQEELLDIWTETGKTVLFVTHDIEEAIKLGDRVVVMDREPGRVQEIVDIDLERPRSRSDRAFGSYYEELLGLIEY